MLVLDPAKRYTVSQIKQHKWMTADNKGGVIERQPMSPGENGTYTFNQQVLEKMCDMGVADEETIKQVQFLQQKFLTMDYGLHTQRSHEKSQKICSKRRVASFTTSCNNVNQLLQASLLATWQYLFTSS